MVKLKTAPPRAPATEYTVPKKGPKNAPAAMSNGRLGMGLTTTAIAIMMMKKTGARLPCAASHFWMYSGLKYEDTSQRNWKRRKMSARAINAKPFMK